MPQPSASAPDINFFYNKDTPSYWKFFFWLILQGLPKLKFLAFVFAILFFFPNIFSQVKDISSTFYHTYQNHSASEKSSQLSNNKDLISQLSATDIEKDILFINSQISYVYKKAMNSDYAKQSSTNRGAINSSYNDLSSDIQKELLPVFKLLTMIKYPTDYNLTTLTSKEVADAITTLSSFKNTNKLATNSNFKSLLNYISN